MGGKPSLRKLRSEVKKSVEDCKKIYLRLDYKIEGIRVEYTLGEVLERIKKNTEHVKGAKRIMGKLVTPLMYVKKPIDEKREEAKQKKSKLEKGLDELHLSITEGETVLPEFDNLFRILEVIIAGFDSEEDFIEEDIKKLEEIKIDSKDIKELGISIIKADDIALLAIGRYQKLHDDVREGIRTAIKVKKIATNLFKRGGNLHHSKALRDHETGRILARREAEIRIMISTPLGTANDALETLRHLRRALKPYRKIKKEERKIREVVKDLEEARRAAA